MNRNKRKNIIWNELIEKTVNFMVNNKLDYLNPNEKLSNREGVWAKLSELVFQEQFTISNALYLSKNWERDRNGFRTLVLKLVKNSNENTQNTNYLQFSLLYSDWLEIQKFVSTDKNQRKYFLCDFDKWLSSNLQKQGIKCFIKCSFNYFSRKPDPVWKGLYKCIDCKNNFSIRILNIGKKYTLYAYWNKSINHEFFVEPPTPRICGEKRKNLSYELKAKGVSNFVSENSNGKSLKFVFFI